MLLGTDMHIFYFYLLLPCTSVIASCWLAEPISSWLRVPYSPALDVPISTF
jgi:hypothetical protein